MTNHHKENIFAGLTTIASFAMCWYLSTGENAGVVLKTIGAAVGGNWLSEYGGHYIRELKNRWLKNDKPAINDHIARALHASFKKAISDVSKTYELHIPPEEKKRERKLIRGFSDALAGMAESLFLEKINDSFDKNELFQYLSLDKTTVGTALQQQLQLDENIAALARLFSLPDTFLQHFLLRLPERVSFYFREGLLHNTEARQAMDMLYNEMIRIHVSLIPSLATKLDKQAEILERLIQSLQGEKEDELRGIMNTALTKLAGDITTFSRQLHTQPRLKYDYRGIGKESKTIFRSRAVRFSGREAELSALKTFFYSPGAFEWWLITGTAGTGKSRLAMEFCFELSKEADIWAGFLDRAVLEKFQWLSWKPSRPTLILIDYASNDYEIIIQLIKDLHSPWEEFAFPVRVLLLERELKGKWWEKISYEIDQLKMPGHYGDGALALEKLGSENIWSIVADIFEGSNLPLPAKIETIDLIHSIDEQERPIFAIFSALALLAGNNIRGWDRTQLLDSYLKREETEIWLPAFGNDGELLEQYKNLLAYVTICNGLSANEIPSLLEKSYKWLPPGSESGTKVNRLFSVLSDQSTAIRYAPMEPDILGEYFVLKRFQRLDKEKVILINSAWTISPVGMFSFVVRFYQDFRDERANIELLPVLSFEKECIQEYCIGIIEVLLFLSDIPYNKMEVRGATQSIKDGHYVLFSKIESVLNRCVGDLAECEWDDIKDFMPDLLKMLKVVALGYYQIQKSFFDYYYSGFPYSPEQVQILHNIVGDVASNVEFITKNHRCGREVTGIEDVELVFPESEDYRNGIRKVIAEDYVVAIQCFEAVVKKDETCFLAFFYSGFAREQLQLLDEAISDYSSALQLNKAHLPSILRRAFVYYEKGDVASAHCDADNIIDINSHSGYRIKAELYALAENYNNAISELDKAIVLMPDHGYLYRAKGFYKSKTGEYEEAVAAFDKALELNCIHPNIYKNRAFAYMKLNKHDNALVDIDKAIALQSDFPEAQALREEILNRHPA